MKRRFVAAILAAGLFSSPTAAQIPQGDIQVGLDVIASWSPTVPMGGDFELTPTDVVPIADGTSRMLAATLGGVIRVVDADDNLLDDPLLTTTQVGLQLQQESGMTGIALHPDFATPDAFGYGKLYTITTEDPVLGDDSVDFPLSGEVQQDVVREWDISAIVGDANVNSLPQMQLGDSREMLRVAQPGPFHDVFDLAFNANAEPGSTDYGQLYISSGDGGGDPTQSQNLGSIYGNVLRINPDPTAHELVRVNQNSGLPAYSISPDNPFNGDDAEETRNRPGEMQTDTLAEIFAYGFRSPYRITFDSVTGDLYLGDVGAGSREEVDLVIEGQNYGWPNREGTQGVHPPGGSVDPLFEYDHSEGRTVVGGFVYRGTAIPELVGKYVFAEFGEDLDSSRLFYGIVDENDPDGNVGEFFEFELDPLSPQFPIDTNGDLEADALGDLPDRIFSIAEDENGELMLVAGQDPRSHAPSVPGAYIVRLLAGATAVGDFNGDSLIDEADWRIIRDKYGSDLSGMLPADAIAMGDIDRDFDVDIDDALQFKQIFLVENGAELAALPSLEAPEPAAVVMMAVAAAGLLAMRRKQGSWAHRMQRGPAHAHHGT